MRAGMPADQDEDPLGAPAPSPAGFHKMQSGETSRTSASIDRIGVTRLVMGRDGPARAPALPGRGSWMLDGVRGGRVSQDVIG